MPFNAKFEESDTSTKTNYADELVQKCSGDILMWCIEGAKKFIENGCKLGIQPKAVKDASEQYRRDEADRNKLDAEDEVLDILHEAEQDKRRTTPWFRWRYCTVSAFKADNPALSRYTVKQVSQALDKIGIKQERKKINGVAARVRKLPCRDFPKAGIGDDETD